MQLACPQCGTRDIRVSHRQSLAEILKAIVGVYPLRCRRCRTRWETSVWAGGAWKYARCPRCYRQDLSTWSERYYRPPGWTHLMLRMGATPYRCAACRCNFASFRPCKERFSWKKSDDQKSDAEFNGSDVEENREPIAHPAFERGSGPPED
jgi:hypothetical protein